MHASFDPRAFDYSAHFRQVGFGSELACLEISRDGSIVAVAHGTTPLGYPADELIGRNLAQLLPLNEAALLSTAREKPNETVRCTFLHKNGAPRVADVCFVNDRLVIVASSREISVDAARLDVSDDIGRYYDELDYSHDSNFHFGLYEHEGESYGAAAERLLAEFFANTGPLAGQTVLEIGCGTGNAALRLATEYGCARVDAITISSRQHEMCLASARSSPAGAKVHFMLGDAHDVPLPPGTYDAVVAMECLFHMDRTRIFARCMEALRPGGLLAFCDIYPVNGGIVHTRAGAHTFISVGQSIALLRAAGFRDIRLVDWSDRALPSYRDVFRQIIAVARFALKRGLTLPQTFETAAKILQQEPGAAVKAQIVEEVLAQQRGESKADPGLGYFFASARKPSGA